MVASVTVILGSYLLLYFLTGNLWISIVAAVICCIIWNFMGGGK